MKMGPDALGSAQNENGSAKHENGTRRPSYVRKLVRVRKTWKRDPTPSVMPNTSPGAQNMKTGPTPSTPPKTSPGAQNIKTGPDALGNVENESGPVEQENGT
jgi:hypothetical protein